MTYHCVIKSIYFTTSGNQEAEVMADTANLTQPHIPMNCAVILQIQWHDHKAIVHLL